MGSKSYPRAPQRITTGFAFSYIDRAIREGLAVRQFGKKEMDQVLDYFGEDACVYCGTRPITRWDHLVAVKMGGDTVVGNMVPACSRCDDSKQHRPFDTWMKSEAPHSPKSRGIVDLDRRCRRLQNYAKRFRYVPQDLSERCPATELEALQSRVQELRSDIERFIEKHRHQTSGEVRRA